MTDWKTGLHAEMEEAKDEESQPWFAKTIAWGIVLLLLILVVVPVVTLLAKGWVNVMRWIVAL